MSRERRSEKKQGEVEDTDLNTVRHPFQGGVRGGEREEQREAEGAGDLSGGKFDEWQGCVRVIVFGIAILQMGRVERGKADAVGGEEERVGCGMVNAACRVRGVVCRF